MTVDSGQLTARMRASTQRLSTICKHSQWSLAIVAFGLSLATQAAEPALTAEQQQGRALFESTCVYCHNPRGWATERLKSRNGEDRAVLTDRVDLDPAYIRTVVRNGLVSMPAYTPTDLSEAEIKAIAAYLTARN